MGATKEPVELQRHIQEDTELKSPQTSFVQDLEVIQKITKFVPWPYPHIIMLMQESDVFEWKIEKLSIPRLRGTKLSL